MALITHEFPFSSIIVPKYNVARHSTEQAWQIGTHGYLDAGHMEISPATTDVYGSSNVSHRVVSNFDGTNGVPVTLQFPVPRRVVLYYGRRAVRVVAIKLRGRQEGSKSILRATPPHWLFRSFSLLRSQLLTQMASVSQSRVHGLPSSPVCGDSRAQPCPVMRGCLL